MKPKHKKRYALMGQIVTVQKVLMEKSDGSWYRRDFETLTIEKPRAGWVVGFRHLRKGRIISHGDEGSTFQPDGTIPTVQVVYWPTQRPVSVPLDGFTPGGEPDLRNFSWPESSRQSAREDAKHFPRKNGRFCKGPLLPKPPFDPFAQQ